MSRRTDEICLRVLYMIAGMGFCFLWTLAACFMSALVAGFLCEIGLVAWDHVLFGVGALVTLLATLSCARYIDRWRQGDDPRQDFCSQIEPLLFLPWGIHRIIAAVAGRFDDRDLLGD